MTTSTPTPETPTEDNKARNATRVVMALTVTRFVAAPIVAGLILWGHTIAFTSGAAAMGALYAAALAVFLLAAITDWADGALARRARVASPLGAALDHAADKVLTTVTLIALAYAILPLPLVVAALILIGRDLAVAGLREGLAGAGPSVGFFGKLKATAAMVGVAAVLAQAVAGAFGWPREASQALGYLAHAALWAAAALALWSGGQYVLEALRGNVAPPR